MNIIKLKSKKLNLKMKKGHTKKVVINLSKIYGYIFEEKDKKIDVVQLYVGPGYEINFCRENWTHKSWEKFICKLKNHFSEKVKENES